MPDGVGAHRKREPCAPTRSCGPSSVPESPLSSALARETALSRFLQEEASGQVVPIADPLGVWSERSAFSGPPGVGSWGNLGRSDARAQVAGPGLAGGSDQGHPSGRTGGRQVGWESVTNSACSMAIPRSHRASAFRAPTRWSAGSMPVGVCTNEDAESRWYGTPAPASRGDDHGGRLHGLRIRHVARLARAPSDDSGDWVRDIWDPIREPVMAERLDQCGAGSLLTLVL